MLKACLKLFTTGISFIIIGAIGISVLGINGLLSIPLRLPVDETLESVPVSSFEQMIIDSADGIDTIDITAGMGTFNIVQGEQFSIDTYNINTESFSYKVNNGCLEIDYSPSFRLLDFNFEKLNESTEIIVTIPDRTFKKVTLSLDAGEFNANGITTDDLIINFNAGSAEFENINANSSAEINMDLGECTFKNSYFNDVEVNMDAGEMNFDKCKLLGKNYIDIDLGELNLKLIGKRSNYKFDISNDLGEVTIDGIPYSDNNSVTTMTNVTFSDNEVSQNIIEKAEPAGTIVVDLDLGECNIEFTED